MKLSDYFRKFHPDKAHRPETKPVADPPGKFGTHSVDKSDTEADSQINISTPFSQQDVRQLTLLSRKARAVLQSVLGIQPAASTSQVPVRKIVRYLRIMVGTIKAALQSFFLPTPSNIRFLNTIDQMEAIMSQFEALDAKKASAQLKDVCKKLRKLTHSKEFDVELKSMLGGMLTLTESLREAVRHGMTDVLLNLPEEQEEEFFDALSDLDEQSGDVAEKEQAGGTHTPLSSEKPLRLPELSMAEIQAQLSGIPPEKCNVKTLMEERDLEALLKLQKAYPDAFLQAEDFVPSLLSGFNQNDWLLNDSRQPLFGIMTTKEIKGLKSWFFDSHILRELIEPSLSVLPEKALVSGCCELARINLILNKLSGSSAKGDIDPAPIKELFDQLKAKWSDNPELSKEFYDSLMRTVSEDAWLIPASKLTTIIPEDIFMEALSQRPLLIRNFLRLAYEEHQVLPFLEMMKRHQLSFVDTERVGGSILSDYHTGEFSDEELREILALGVEVDAKNANGEYYLKNSETFPYDHQVILRYKDPGLEVSDVLPLYRKNKRSSAMYTWDPKANNLKLEAGKQRAFTGKYKLVITAHGSSLAITDGSRMLPARHVAESLVELIRSQGGVAPEKITIASCCTGNHIPMLGSFAGNLTKALHKRGISTLVSSTSGYSSTLSNGRHVKTNALSLNGIESKFVTPMVQTKSPELHTSGYKLTTGLKVLYWMDEHGKLQSRKE